MRRPFLKSLCLLTVAALAACGTSPGPTASPEADREIFVMMRDDFSYDPAEIEVTTGENISFQVSNKGALRHEFLIGTPKQHADHAKQMAEGNEHGAHESALKGVTVESGKEATFTFIIPKKGDLLFGCHEVGHYEQGMKGNMKYKT
jgi:uncharacterized cupredoxin-like copper-binding protein